VTEIGYLIDSTNRLDFCFDNETPRHKVYLEGFGIANRSATCREYLEFMSDDGYARPEFWPFRGLGSSEETGVAAPLYWERVPRIALAGASSPFEVGIRFQRCLIRPYAT
jgi:formylglycine-generating enzyme required for sulfatase activity